MKLIVQPDSGVAPIVAAIKGARKSVEIAIFRFEHKAIEAALNEAAARGVRVTALIAFINRGGAKSLRKLELRLLDAGIIVARTADDLIRYHAKYILIDRRVLYVLSFNFTRLDIDHSRGFGVITTRAACVKEAVKLFKADCTRVKYVAKADTFVVSPVNSRRVLGAFLRGAKKQLLVYDPKISDREMLRILQERAKAGVEIQVIGQVAGRVPYDVKKLGAMRLHTRTIIRDRRQAFVGSQSLRSAELDSRREVGVIVQDARSVKTLVDTFESDWKRTAAGDAKKDARPPKEADESPAEASPKEMAKAVKAFTKELAPLAIK
jgi:phosphatidylserine/phosphatidylglycerophosphate/cardiolipin synthase-like enzyme